MLFNLSIKKAQNVLGNNKNARWINELTLLPHSTQKLSSLNGSNLMTGLEISNDQNKK